MSTLSREAKAADLLFDPHSRPTAEETASSLDELINAGVWYDAPRCRWLVSRWDDAQRVLSSKALSNNLQLARPTTKSGALATRLGKAAPALLFVDPPDHGPVRALLSSFLSPSRVRSLLPFIRMEAERVVQAASQRDTFDLGTEIAQPLAASVVLRALNFSTPQQPEIYNLIADLFSINKIFDLTCTPEEVALGADAGVRVRTRVEDEFHKRPALERSVLALGASREISIASLVFSLRAGVVTTSCLLVHLLLRHFRDRACDAAPEESLEASIASSTPALEAGRVTASAFHVGGTRIPERETVICVLPAANRDLMSRKGSSPRYLTFGAGRHRCSGEHLVRAEAQALLDSVRRLGRMIQPTGEAEIHAIPSFRGVRAILVKWRKSNGY